MTYPFACLGHIYRTIRGMHDRLNPWSREESRCSHGSLQSCSGKEFGESSRSEGSGEKGLPAWHGLASEAKENWQGPGNGNASA
ncbi:hypothetical protein MGG_16857 [Pyricularia oryzae 70-15]|uniref:Uncharacterized protein n=1 Tax=Pyricularia oryzae (strain 70-15 / ATCC MYA-4617 / FGSC 8958) TaxID=242507 RepID=G4N463_PYRO7|nr:uncharacterized protein MGG_16857 [Pyricularia oryzae 70-15]EHA52783.1 hypothetical protein MGG_16857 [Pyricularia oryzae 70-15]